MFAYLGTTASMIAFINNVVAGSGVALLANALLGGGRTRLAFGCGGVSAVILTVVFLAFQRWRFSSVDQKLSKEKTQ